MDPQFQFARRSVARFAVARFVAAVLLLGAFSVHGAAVRADNAPSGAVARVEGRDISVEGGVAASDRQTTSPGIYASNGSVVTVHSGKARMTLLTGGKVAICGPAKFTVLVSGGAITLALNFGRMRVELPAKAALRIFTPTIIGTPIDISGGARDVTVGLELDDSLCVLATSGAIQLEHQFTGEMIIVPQAGEFFLNSGKLLPVAGTPGSCQCLADDSGAPPPAPVTPEFAAVAPSQAAPAAAPTTAATAPEQPAEPEPSVEYAVLEHANQDHPIVASAKAETAAAPPVTVSGETTVMPALVFMAGTPLPPPGPSQDTLLLIGAARVLPEWEFSGRVEPPEFAKAVQQALGEHAVTPAQDAPPVQPTATPKKKKGGLWAALKRVFGGA